MRDQTEQMQAKEELRRHRDHLEELVAERTAELETGIAERTRVEETLRQRNRELALLNRAGQAFSSTLDQDQVLAAVLEQARCLLGVTACSIWLIDPETGELVCRQVTNPQSDVVRGWRLKAGEGIAGWVAVHGASLIVPDVRSDVRHFRGVDRQTGLQVRSILCIPLKAKKDVIGVLQVVDEQVGRFDTEGLRLLESLAAPAAIAIENARLYDLARQGIADRKRAEAALYRSEERARSIAQHLSDIVWIIDEDTRFAYETPSCSAILGYEPGYLFGKEGLGFVHPDDVERISRDLDGVFNKQHQLARTAFRFRHADGHWVQLEAIANNLLDQPGIRGVILTCRDVTERRRLEAQLFQSQKMEAIGRLAGGVAHDFNNLLTVMGSYADLALRYLSADGPVDQTSKQEVRADLEGIQEIVHRAAALTNQLLIFSRKHTPQPKVLDLNDLVHNIDRMLRRLIGEDVELCTILEAQLGRVKADPGHLEQVVMNLAVNARDAMPRGGTLTLETANVELDGDYAQRHLGVQPGHYVMLAVSDTGTGMTEEVKAHLFEPFFTTKEEGKGTGLGLATVYGIVDQSGGHVEVYSELGVGTTFKVYLPRVEEVTEQIRQDQQPQVLPSGVETILLVEDDEMVRDLATRSLERQGYTVLGAEHPDEALLTNVRHDGPIDLLITDVVMPGMGGKELAAWITKERTDTRVLYISGHTDDAIVRHGVLQPETPFLQKPFTPSALAYKVRQALDEKKSKGRD